MWVFVLVVVGILLVILLGYLIGLRVWRHRTFCPDGTKHVWKYNGHIWWYWDGTGGFLCVGPVEHTVVVYYYRCMWCSQEKVRRETYFCRGRYRPDSSDW